MGNLVLLVIAVAVVGGYLLIKRLRQGNRPKLTREQSLASLPVKNAAIEEFIDDAGMVTLRIPRRKAWWISVMGFFFYMPEARTIALDEIGSFVWKLCDGKHTVRDLIAEVSSKYQITKKEAEVSLVAYLRMLGKKRLVAIATPPVKKEPEG